MFDVIVMREPSITSFNHVIRNYDVRQRERQEKAAETKEKELRKEKAFHIGKKGRQSLWTQERTGKKMPDGDAHAHPKGRPKFRGGTTGSHPFWRELQVPLPSIVSLRAEVTTVKLGTGYVFVCVYVLGKTTTFTLGYVDWTVVPLWSVSAKTWVIMDWHQWWIDAAKCLS